MLSSEPVFFAIPDIPTESSSRSYIDSTLFVGNTDFSVEFFLAGSCVRALSCTYISNGCWIVSIVHNCPLSSHFAKSESSYICIEITLDTEPGCSSLGGGRTKPKPGIGREPMTSNGREGSNPSPGAYRKTTELV